MKYQHYDRYLVLEIWQERKTDIQCVIIEHKGSLKNRETRL